MTKIAGRASALALAVFLGLPLAGGGTASLAQGFDEAPDCVRPKQHQDCLELRFSLAVVNPTDPIISAWFRGADSWQVAPQIKAGIDAGAIQGYPGCVQAAMYAFNVRRIAHSKVKVYAANSRRMDPALFKKPVVDQYGEAQDVFAAYLCNSREVIFQVPKRGYMTDSTAFLICVYGPNGKRIMVLPKQPAPGPGVVDNGLWVTPARLKHLLSIPNAAGRGAFVLQAPPPPAVVAPPVPFPPPSPPLLQPYRPQHPTYYGS
ncbi:MAG TPA: hypothetical protein VD967_00440 [Candidatus Paceibacterota bacterium]|nr:hypothetical protein [Candidatus Paceibacterota bacterium]